ncbi:MAG: EscU/YscU/HrcU family type III secretion system export apparatus switch protein [Leptospirales bacterium]|nr:EscU/YscU/HrcU family type III secretion system export apparatus switch protein [Leptospirales bacterium]
MDRKVAAALKFDPTSDRAPRLVALGEGPVAEEILRLAQAGEVPIKEDGELAGFLLDLPIGQEIPENLYRAVSAVFAMLFRLEGGSK